MQDVFPSWQHRITPACAGNRLYGVDVALWRRDHPRVCGEQQYLNQKDQQEVGSPPRVRGTGHHGRKAGGQGRDHPRVCGEQLFPSL